jgi:hypothetical protein
LQIAHQKHYANNKKKVLEKTAEYREKNPEKTKQIEIFPPKNTGINIEKEKIIVKNLSKENML